MLAALCLVSSQSVPVGRPFWVENGVVVAWLAIRSCLETAEIDARATIYLLLS